MSELQKKKDSFNSNFELSHLDKNIEVKRPLFDID
jgi:hypothetical protein